MEQGRLPIFAERFNKLRGKMTQAEFADFLGISRPTIGFYENGSRLPDALVLMQIAKKCNVSADWLLGISDTASTDANIRAACICTGLNEQTVSILESNSYWCHSEMLDCINFLVKQEEPHPFAEYPEYFSSEDAIPEWLDVAEDNWKKKELVPILSLIWDFIRSESAKDNFHIDAHGNIEKINKDATGLAAFHGMSLDGLRLIDGQKIYDQVLTFDIIDKLKKLRERYRQNGGVEHGKHKAEN